MPENTDNIREANPGEIWGYSWTEQDPESPIWRKVKINKVDNNEVEVIRQNGDDVYNGKKETIKISDFKWKKFQGLQQLPPQGGRSKTRKNKKKLKKRKNKSRKYFRKSYIRK